MKLTFMLVGCIWLSMLGTAHARVQRFAIIVGNNQGAPDEETLRYAESDASKVHDVLRDLGGFAPADIALLRSDDADALRNTLITVNDRIRRAQAEDDVQALLLVYYSGHADADALHLGNSRLPMQQLAELVRGSAARFRVLVLDACQSGAITRLKGGRVTRPFALPSEETLASEGVAILTASSPNESAQESDELKGSFFTHSLVSGMLGAADRDGDGVVVLEEAYRFAYDGTLRATATTVAGMQHPMFRYDVRGHGDFPLTTPEAFSRERGMLRFPRSISFLVTRDVAGGAVIGEVSAEGAGRNLSVRPGTYFLRGRARDHMLEGRVTIRSGQVYSVDVGQLSRVEYARLVRKGQHSRTLAQGLELGARTRSPLPNAESYCSGGFAGYRFDRQQLSMLGRLGFCGAKTQSISLESRVYQYDLDLTLEHAWDVPWLTLSLGLGGSVSLFTQSFRTEGRAPTRVTWVPAAHIVAAITHDLPRGLYLRVDAQIESYALKLMRSDTREVETQPAVSVQPSLALGKYF